MAVIIFSEAATPVCQIELAQQSIKHQAQNASSFRFWFELHATKLNQFEHAPRAVCFVFVSGTRTKRSQGAIFFFFFFFFLGSGLSTAAAAVARADFRNPRDVEGAIVDGVASVVLFDEGAVVFIGKTAPPIPTPPPPPSRAASKPRAERKRDSLGAGGGRAPCADEVVVSRSRLFLVLRSVGFAFFAFFPPPSSSPLHPLPVASAVTPPLFLLPSLEG
mmetsp:Transcript_67600/g.132575  ORF Transcript_67600/g.132575 Transcript_67600/m.132575 type:complete len:219 (+) Transcript_67600:38-694(+)